MIITAVHGNGAFFPHSLTFCHVWVRGLWAGSQDAKPCEAERGDPSCCMDCMYFEEEEYDFDYGSGGEEEDDE